MTEFGIYIVRIPEERGNNIADIEDLKYCRSCQLAQLNSTLACQIYSSYNIKSPDAFIGCSLCSLVCGYDTTDFLSAIDTQCEIFLKNNSRSDVEESGFTLLVAKRCILEAMCHPGYPSEGWDDFSASIERTHELLVMKDPALRKGLEQRNTRLCSHLESSLLAFR